MRRKINVRPGAFPFPLLEGPDESRYLTWVRNHSNYLAERGFVDYMRIVAILVRGILVNFLTLLPYLMAGALVLGLLYNAMLDDWQRQVELEAAAVETASDDAAAPLFLTRGVSPEGAPAPLTVWDRIGSWVWWAQDRLPWNPPYLLTPLVALLALAHYLLFPVVVRLFKVMGHKRSLETGSDSSVKQRDAYELTFGGALITILLAAAVESLPLLVHHFHSWGTPTLRGGLSTATGALSVMALSGAGKIVSLLGPAKRKIALLLVGLLGLLLPLVVVVRLTEFLVYAPPGESYPVSPIALAAIPALLAVGLLVALGLCWGKVTRRETGWLVTLLLPVLATVAAMVALAPIVPGRWFFVLVVAAQLWLFCWLAVDVNLTSVLGLYRDRLASAYLVGEDTAGDVDIEEDVDLHHICLYEALSHAPYHLINTAHNLQGSRDIAIRERNSDFFVFSKRFVGSDRTGYCRSESLEKVFPQMDLATAMAISAAAAAPNMGSNTSRALVALLTILNIRLGYWIPNPGLLAGRLAADVLAMPDGAERRRELRRWGLAPPGTRMTDEGIVEERLGEMAAAAARPAQQHLERRDAGYRFDEVFRAELAELQQRWGNLYGSRPAARRRPDGSVPSPDLGLVGLAFSGGGIRSATLNMGIAQALDRAGVFPDFDYLSTVSGGGYLGSSLSTLMRRQTPLHSRIAGETRVTDDGEVTRVEVTGEEGVEEYLFRPGVELSEAVVGGRVERGAPLLHRSVRRAGLQDRFAWRVRPDALGRELLSRVDETHRWVNLSDGGHIENLATFELLRRRCRFIVTGDGGADRGHAFSSLATLIRFARIDLGVEIEIDLDDLRLSGGEDESPLSNEHLALGRVWYPRAGGGYEETPAYILYLKASCTGDEDEVIRHYRKTHPAFPHETTADQFFDEGQFEAYRSLGQHIGRQALRFAPGGGEDVFDDWIGREKTVDDYFVHWFEAMEEKLPHRWRAEGPGRQGLETGAPPGFA